MKDYLVVGLGIAGIAMCETLEKEGRSFMVFDPGNSPSATRVAGGIYNPVVLKRLKLAWNADVQLPAARSFYEQLQGKLGTPIHEEVTVVRSFASANEQNDWFEATDSPSVGEFLQTSLVPNTNDNIFAPYDFGKVMGPGRVDTPALLEAYREYLRRKENIREETFDLSELKLERDHIQYKEFTATKIIFCTGHALHKNMFFNYLPLRGNKGEYIKVRIPGLNESKVVKAGVFLIPEGNDLYTVGATYNRQDLHPNPTSEGREYLLEKLRKITPLPVEVVDQVAGIRPTVPDRRPLVGQHPEETQLYLLNGFGSRGLMIAPTASGLLFDLMEHGKPLPPEIDLQRFTRKWFPKN